MNDPYSILKLEFDGIANVMCSYSRDQRLSNLVEKMQGALLNDNIETVLYILNQLCEWYEEHFDDIVSNKFVTNLDSHKRCKKLLEELYHKMQQYPVIQSKNEGPTTPSNKAPKLFISHTSKDAEFVQCLVHLFESIGLTNKDVFCSSLPRYGIPNDEDLFTALLEQFRKYALHVIVVHSQNYYKSPISLNEMGAAWVLHAKCTSFLLPGFPVEGMEGVVNRNTIAIKLDDDELSVKDRMNQFYNTIIDEFGLAKMDELLWEEKRDVFIRSVKGLHYEIVKNHDNENEENGAQYRFIPLKKEAEDILRCASEDDHGMILIVKTLSGTTIQAGTHEMNQNTNNREVQRWLAGIEDLKWKKYIEQIDLRGERFCITNAGYEYIEQLNEVANMFK